MAQPAEALWQLAHNLHAHESLGESGCIGSIVRGTAASAAGAHQDRSGESGQHHSQSTSGRDRCSKKNGAQAIGKSRAGWSTKIHMVDAHARWRIALWPS